MLRRFRLPAAAVAAGLPALLAGMLAAPSATVLVGPDDSMVRTVTVDPPASAPTDEDLGLDGAHPPVDPASLLGDGEADDGDDRSRGLPVRVSGTSIPARVLLAYRNAAAELRPERPGLRPALEPGGRDRQGRVRARVRRRAGPARPHDGPDPRPGAQRGRVTWPRSPTPTAGSSTATPPGTARWGRCSSSRRPGRSGAGTATATGAATPPTSTTRHWPPASYLCAGDRDLAREKDRRSAVFSYNHSWDYVDLVLAWADAYATGTTPVPGTQLAAGRDGRVDDVATGRGDGTAGPRATGPAPTTAPGQTPTGSPASAARLGGTAQRRAGAGTQQQPVGHPAARPGTPRSPRRCRARPRRPPAARPGRPPARTGDPTATPVRRRRR